MRRKQFAEHLELCPLSHLCTCEKAASLSFDSALFPNITGLPEVLNDCVQLSVLLFNLFSACSVVAFICLFSGKVETGVYHLSTV